MKIVVLVGMLCGVLQVGFSQSHQEFKRTLSAGVAYISHHFIDRHASPLRYDNQTILYGIQYIHNTANGRHRVMLGYDGGQFTTALSEPGRLFEDYFRIFFEGGYVHRLFSMLNSDLHIMGGFYFDNIFTYREHYYFEDHTEHYIEFISAFHPTMELHYRITNRHYIGTRVGASAFAYLHHSPYSVRGPLEHSFQFFNSFRRAGFLFSYQYLINDRILMDLSYAISYHRHSVPHDHRSASEHIMLQIGYGI